MVISVKTDYSFSVMYLHIFVSLKASNQVKYVVAPISKSVTEVAVFI